MLRVVRICGCLLALATTVSMAAPAPVATPEQNLARLRDIALAPGIEHQRDANLRAEYRQHFRPLQDVRWVSTSTAAELRAAYGAAGVLATHTQDTSFLRDMQLDLSELQRRKLVDDESFRQMYGALIATRRFAEANTLARRHPSAGLERVPPLIESSDLKTNGATELAFAADGKSVIRRHVVRGKGPHIVVVVQPLDPVSRTALAAIEADAGMAAAFKDHTTWLAPPDNQLHQTEFTQWNAAHPTQTMTLAYRRSEWPQLDDWHTPTFYFLNNGKLITKLSGWPTAGQSDQMKAALRQIGLLPSR